MIHSVRFTCVLDTNVIYPIEIRDLILWFAHFDLFTPKWTEEIFSELERVMRDKGVTEKDIKKRQAIMNKAFPDALVLNYQGLISSLNLPDPNDRHVLAAAIKTNANLIITSNLRDFPDAVLSKYGLAAKCPDDFLADIIDLNPAQAVKAFRALVLNRRNPDLDEYQVLDRLRKIGLRMTADFLHSQI